MTISEIWGREGYWTFCARCDERVAWDECDLFEAKEYASEHQCGVE